MGNCPLLRIVPFYEYRCQKHGRFETMQGMFSAKVANCPKCRQPAEFRISLSSFRIAVPLIVYQELPHGQGYQVLDKKPDSSDSADRNYDIPPDYPNLIV